MKRGFCLSLFFKPLLLFLVQVEGFLQSPFLFNVLFFLLVIASSMLTPDISKANSKGSTKVQHHEQNDEMIQILLQFSNGVTCYFSSTTSWTVGYQCLWNSVCMWSDRHDFKNDESHLHYIAKNSIIIASLWKGRDWIC